MKILFFFYPKGYGKWGWYMRLKENEIINGGTFSFKEGNTFSFYVNKKGVNKTTGKEYTYLGRLFEPLQFINIKIRYKDSPPSKQKFNKMKIIIGSEYNIANVALMYDTKLLLSFSVSTKFSFTDVTFISLEKLLDVRDTFMFDYIKNVRVYD